MRSLLLPDFGWGGGSIGRYEQGPLVGSVVAKRVYWRSPNDFQYVFVVTPTKCCSMKVKQHEHCIQQDRLPRSRH